MKIWPMVFGRSGGGQWRVVGRQEVDERFRKERGRPVKGCRSSRGATTFFFSNFPATHGEYNMFRVF